MAIEIVDLPIENGGYFHSFLYVNQRVYHIKSLRNHGSGMFRSHNDDPMMVLGMFRWV